MPPPERCTTVHDAFMIDFGKALEQLPNETLQLEQEPPTGESLEEKRKHTEWHKLKHASPWKRIQDVTGLTGLVLKSKLLEVWRSFGVAAFYRPLVELATLHSDTDLRPLLIQNVNTTASAPVGRGKISLAVAVFKLCPPIKDLALQVLATQKPWTNIVKSGNGQGSRPGRKIAAAQRAEAQLTQEEGNNARLDDTSPLPVKKARVSEHSNNDEQTECVTCMNKEKNTVILPCKHMCVCSVCAADIGPLCPICRGPVEDTMTVYN